MIKRLAILILLPGILSCAVANASDNKDSDELILQQAKKFQVLLQTIHGHYVDSVDIEKLSEKAFNEMLRDLDPASAYFPAKETKELEDEQEGEETGIGAKLVSLNDTIHVFEIIDGSPADSAGLKRADKILFIDGNNISGLSQAEVYGLINGERGTEVSIIAKRGYGSALEEYKIERNLYPLSTISTYFLIEGTDIGYVNISRFSRKSHDEFLEVTGELKNTGMEKMIIDLRGNPGGFLRTASRIADEFIPAGKKLVYTDARNTDYRQEQVSTSSTAFPDMPLIILVDSATASAGEALAGAIQDLDRGLVVGERTYGKGSAQKTWNFNDGSAFRLTIAEYLTPSGRSIQKDRGLNEELPELNPALELEKSKEEIEKIGRAHV